MFARKVSEEVIVLEVPSAGFCRNQIAQLISQQSVDFFLPVKVSAEQKVVELHDSLLRRLRDALEQQKFLHLEADLLEAHSWPINRSQAHVRLGD